MAVNRRAFLGGGLAASLWAWRRAGGAEAPLGVPRRLDAAPASLQLAPPPAPPTRILAYDGVSPGPLLRLRKGETLALTLANRLAEPTSLSFPGLRTANAAAGIAGLTQPPVAPGAEADIRFVPPDAGFNLYLPDCGAATAKQIAGGLYGPVVVEEAAAPAADLETIVVLSEWRLDAKGEIEPASADSAAGRAGGRIGALVAANGPPAPLTLSAAPGARVRLRLANAATARLMMIGVDGLTPLIVAVDGQPSEPFEPLRNMFPLGPGGRYELMFDLPRETGAAARFILRGGDVAAIAGESDRPLVVFEARGEARPARPPIAGLPANPLLPKEIALELAKRVDLVLAGGGADNYTINGTALCDWSPQPLFAVARGQPVTLGFVNRTAVVQAMRLGGHVARELHALDDGWDPYWRDVVIVPPGRTVHAAFVADNPGKWPIASATPECRAAGLCGWFQAR